MMECSSSNRKPTANPPPPAESGIVHAPNPHPNSSSQPSAASNAFLSTPLPKATRRGRLPNPSNSNHPQPFSASTKPNFSRRPPPDLSDEIIVINKEATAEALIALTAGFPADSLTDEEIDFGVVSDVGGIEQVNYILIRNHIIMRWRENVKRWLTKEMFLPLVPNHCWKLLDSAYSYLVAHGYINFGVAPEITQRLSAQPTMGNVIIIGAGLAGLAAARQLMSFGFKVVVLEGRKRAGGRVYTMKIHSSDGKKVGYADLGGSVLTGTLGNPLGILARQLSFKLHKIRDKCPLYRVDGTPVDPQVDRKVEVAFNDLLDTVSKHRKMMGEVSQDISLGAALETFKALFDEEEMNLFNWHLANLEYANAGLLSSLSLAFWDQDDPYDMGGDHCFLHGGNGKLVDALVENVPIHYERTVSEIRYGDNGVQVTAGSQVYEGDMVLCTVPLGVLKRGSIKFIPELPQRKLDGIKRLGFGLLNKVVMLFPYPFWGTDLDTFGHLSDDPSNRGEFFLFYSYATVAGGAILIGLVAGEAAYRFEALEGDKATERAVEVLRGIYRPRGIDIPNPVQAVCTRWNTDTLSYGSYSNVAVGASGDDYDILAESVGDGRLFFAGEATIRRYPATMHGALLSGFREAANMSHSAKVRSLGLKVEKNPSKSAHDYASILADLFRNPDVEFGSFAIMFGRKKSESMAILRVTFGRQRKMQDQRCSNEILFAQLQSHFDQQQEFHVYTVLSRPQANELREVRGGDEARLNFLSEKLGIKLLGRKGLGPSADSIIASIEAARSQGRRKDSSGGRSAIKGESKSKAPNMKQKQIRKARILRNVDRSSTRGAKLSGEDINGSTNVIATSGISTGMTYPREGNEIGASGSNSTNVIGIPGISSGVASAYPCEGHEIGVRGNNPHVTPPGLDSDGAVVNEIGDSLRQNADHDKSTLSTPVPSISQISPHDLSVFPLGYRSSNSSDTIMLDPPDSNVGMMLAGDVGVSNPPHFNHESSVAASSSNTVERALNISNCLPSVSLNSSAELVGDIRNGDTPKLENCYDSMVPASSEAEVRASSNDGSVAPLDSNMNSFDAGVNAGVITEDLGGISIQESSIFDEIMNEFFSRHQ